MAAEYGAVVNPKLLYAHGMQFSLSRMKVHSWSTLQARLSKTGLDIYTLFGPSDILCKHYRAENFEVRDLLREENIPDPFYSDVSEFPVAGIDKMEGLDIDWARDIDVTPTETDLADLDALQLDWEACTQERRDQLIESGMILREPSQHTVEGSPVSAVVFAKMLGVDTEEDLSLSRNYLQTALFKPWWPQIRGLFWGFPHAHFQFAVELLTKDLQTLITFVMRDLQSSLPRGIDTATHLVIEHVARGPVHMLELFRRLALDLQAYDKQRLDTILAQKMEGPHVEFKASLRWSFNENRVDKELVRVVVKELAAFMNTQGGLVLIGVNDEGIAVGIEKDLEALSKGGTDGFRLALAQGIQDCLGTEFIGNVTVTFPMVEGKLLCAVDVRKGPKPAFLKGKQGRDKEFYIRTDNSSRALDMEATMDYIRMNWPQRS